MLSRSADTTSVYRLTFAIDLYLLGETERVGTSLSILKSFYEYAKFSSRVKEILCVFKERIVHIQNLKSCLQLRKKHKVCIFKALISKHPILTYLYSQVYVIVKYFMGYYYVFGYSTLRRPIIGTSFSNFRHGDKLQQVKWAQNNSRFDSTTLDLVRPFQQIRPKEYKGVVI